MTTTSILLISIDCLRPDHVGTYGYSRDTTPALDALASDGQFFDPVYSNGPGTRYAFKPILFGHHPLMISGAGLPAEAGQTVAERFSGEGYSTAAFTDNPFLSKHFNYDRGFDHFRDSLSWDGDGEGSGSKLDHLASEVYARLPESVFRANIKAIYQRWQTYFEANSSTPSTDSHVVSAATKWLQQQELAGEPYFCWVHLMGPHGPHVFHGAERDALGIRTSHIKDPSHIVSEGNEPPQRVIDTYDASLRRTDRDIRALLQPVSDGTGVVVTADHGEEFGPTGSFHQPSAYESMSRVPLILNEKYDGELPHSHLDIPFLLSNLGGVDPHPSWTRIQSEHQVIGFQTLDNIVGAVVDWPWKYILEQSLDFGPVLNEELFNLEQKNPERVAIDNGEKRSELREVWDRFISDIKDNRLDAERNVWDPKLNLSEEIQRTSDHGRDIDAQLSYLGYK